MQPHKYIDTRSFVFFETFKRMRSTKDIDSGR